MLVIFVVKVVIVSEQAFHCFVLVLVFHAVVSVEGVQFSLLSLGEVAMARVLVDKEAHEVVSSSSFAPDSILTYS